MLIFETTDLVLKYHRNNYKGEVDCFGNADFEYFNKFQRQTVVNLINVYAIISCTKLAKAPMPGNVKSSQSHANFDKIRSVLPGRESCIFFEEMTELFRRGKVQTERDFFNGFRRKL